MAPPKPLKLNILACFGERFSSFCLCVQHVWLVLSSPSGLSHCVLSSFFFSWPSSLSVSPGFSVFVSAPLSVQLVCEYFMSVYLCLKLAHTRVSDYGAVVSVPEQPNGNLAHAPLSPGILPECKNLTHIIMLSPTH